MTKEIQVPTWIKITVFPLIIGIGLTNMSKILFKWIGWGLLIFGLSTGFYYLYKIYKSNKEKINEVKNEFRRKK